MSIRSLVLLAVVLSSRAAFAAPHPCPAGQSWNAERRKCIKVVAAAKLSPQDKYNQALVLVESETKGQPEYGVQLLGQACDGKVGPACTLLGFLYARGRVVKPDAAKAATLFARACDLGDVEGCYDVADAEYSSHDEVKARDAFRHACELGSGMGCARGADLLEATDATAAAAMFKKSFDLLGTKCPLDGQACWVVGYLYFFGKGVTKDLAKARDFYRAGCDANNGDSCRLLAASLDDGSFGAADATAATEAYKSGCGAEDPQSCAALVPRTRLTDPANAFVYAGLACNLDSSQCAALADLYAAGIGTPANPQLATQYYGSACAQNQAAACVTYGQRAHDGVGASADPDEALAAEQIACQLGDGAGCRFAAQYTKDPAVAQSLAIAGCGKGDGESCHLAATQAGDDAQAALDLNTKGCFATTPSPAACNDAGNALVDSDIATARKDYTQGCANDQSLDTAITCENLVRADYFHDPKDLGTALSAAAVACAYGRPDPCGWVSGLAEESGATPETIHDVAAALDEVCSQQQVDGACYGEALLLFKGGEPDRRRALALVDTSCGRKHDPSCLAKANAYSTGTGTMKDDAKAKAIYDQYCASGDADACSQMAIYSSQGSDFERALQYAQTACNGDSPDGCNELGYLYFTGKGTLHDAAKGIDLWDRACTLNGAYGCGNMGYMARYGIGRPLDAKKAFAYYQKSCRPTAEFGCEGTGYYYETGQGVAKDLKKAVDNYKLACDSQAQPYALACSELAALYEANHQGSPSEVARLRDRAFGVAKDRAKDNPFSMYVLATYFRDGIGTPKDPAQAREWFAKGCDGYDPLACLNAGKEFFAIGDHEHGSTYAQRACGTGLDEACKLGGGPKAGEVQRKGCGCSGGGGDGGGALVAIVVVGLIAPRPRRSRDAGR